ncbi:class I mannose-6-phosphate isomerase [Rhodospirillum rubrum]|uniref:Mannose-6-phosphate isomerase n=1 Tax=Rhodospirillum rubrum (strain ATCC 11170 / ATH 1.1.1 / DSM 467 / LMG 4362 / NCIMB 8255 / S1) TaxID=269796 RepID=Q2RVX0_RHORT|nr:class I mannose-6-phosphate isomerase [Rhodospirillum rubrum]ABC21725.1 mannose-6-phosphate isomerase [Rhodospirillum rubrum ATCC 11170]AEO47423.1 mannose-6-phosphate isomerase [Rhodospirillum rubrum F11]MBK5953278.1 mannose-6-phosphate isomerase [Rhodospirillum rubrum]QXG81387.1 class I mannose-6-phosphate isomerase [Rhodospirillum rubrum]HAQ01159.1 mannose-6-phosphate isomerase [Rhodospirillum rubrum]
MTIEQAGLTIVPKPWGSGDLRPWSPLSDPSGPVGELWFERAPRGPPQPLAHPLPKLLLKLLFPMEPLSIQVHPDDASARARGLEHGKSEAWYILSASPGARIGLGLKKPLRPEALGEAIADGSIKDLVSWRTVRVGEAVSVPAGTIHAIGAGLVIAEIQQRSDVTFRLFDYGRARPLHGADALAVAHCGPAPRQTPPRRLTQARTLLIASPFFVLERIDLPAFARGRLVADAETWLLGLGGAATVGALGLAPGQALFLENEDCPLEAGGDGVSALVAYAASEPAVDLLRDLAGLGVETPIIPLEVRP